MFDITNALVNLVEGTCSLLCFGVIVVVVIVTADSVIRIVAERMKGRRP